MRRKLIKQDAFEQIANSSVTNKGKELYEAVSVLSKVLKKDKLNLHSFTESTVLYETEDDTYVHAGYKLDGGNVVFSNIEELVIDEQSKADRRRSILSELIENVLKDKTEQANELFKNYLNISTFTEAKKFVVKNKGDVTDPDFEAEEHDDKKKKPNQLPDKKSPFDKMKNKKEREKNKKEEESSRGENFKKDKESFKKRLKAAGKKMQEAYEVASNVLDYVQYVNLGPVLSESISHTDERGNVTNVRIPDSQKRNEGKLLNFDWKVLNHKLKVLRSGAKDLVEDQNFCKSVVNLKVNNAISDAQGTEDAIDEIASHWPDVLYLTQSELAAVIGEALSLAGERNFDDEVCSFLAEGIMRKVHESYSERVNQVLHLASQPKVEEDTDPYDHFQTVTEEFYNSVDKRFGFEMQVFEDLYESMAEVFRIAERRGDENLKYETSGYLHDLIDILNEQERPNIELAEEVAQWLTRFIESNVTGASDVWNVSNKTHHTINGDHPQMAKNAKVPATASMHNGDWDDPAPMIGSDSMKYNHSNAEEARYRSWGNSGGSDVWPSLKNPYTPKPFGDYTMKGEKGVDKDTFGQHNGSWQSNDTWPNLKNPYIPKEAGATGGQGYKMKNGPETDLVVDKGVNTR